MRNVIEGCPRRSAGWHVIMTCHTSLVTWKLLLFVDFTHQALSEARQAAYIDALHEELRRLNTPSLGPLLWVRLFERLFVSSAAEVLQTIGCGHGPVRAGGIPWHLTRCSRDPSTKTRVISSRRDWTWWLWKPDDLFFEVNWARGRQDLSQDSCQHTAKCCYSSWSAKWYQISF